MNYKILQKFLRRYAVTLGALMLAWFGLVASADAATSGVCSTGTVSFVNPSDGSAIKGSYTVTFTRNGGCTDDVDVYWGKRSVDGVATCAQVTSWTPISTVSDPGTSANPLDTTTLVNNNSDYCFRLKPNGGDGRTTDIIVDNTPPVLNTATTKDIDRDGKIDQIDVTFTEAVGMDNDPAMVANTDGWTVAGMTITGAMWTGQTLSLSFNDNNDVVYTDATPNISYNNGVGTLYTDLAGNELVNYGPTATTDGAAPAIISASTIDDGNGTVDHILVTLSEVVADADLAWNDFSTANGCSVTGISFDAPADDGALRLDVTCTANDTAVLPTVTVKTGQVPDASANTLTGDATFSGTTDGAAPVIISVVYQNTGGAVDVDKIVVTYSENVVRDEYDDADWVIAAGSNDDLVIANESAAIAVGSTIELTVDWANNVTGETGTEPTLQYIAANVTANSIHDASNNNAGNYGPTAMADDADPIIISATTLDADSDGYVDSADLVMSEDMDYSTLSAGEFTIGGNTVNTLNNGGDVDDDTTLKLVLTNNVNEVDGTNVKDVIFTNDGNSTGLDLNNITNVLTGSITEVDGAAPIVSQIAYTDINNNGAVDRVIVRFTETVTYAGLTAGDWVITERQVPINGGGANPSAVADSGNNYLTFTVAGTGSNTGLWNGETDEPQLAYTNSGADVTDGVNNLANFGVITMVDEAAPLVSQVTYWDANNDGNIDRLEVSYSEMINFADGADLRSKFIVGDGNGGVGTVNPTAIGVNGSLQNIALTVAVTGTAVTSFEYDADAGGVLAADSMVDRTANVIKNLGVDQTVSGNDWAEPVLLSAETQDKDGDGFIDSYKLTFSENIDGTTLTSNNANGFAVADFGIGGTGEKLYVDAALTNNAVNGVSANIYYLGFTEDNAYTTGGTGVKPELTYADDNINDAAGKEINGGVDGDIAVGELTETDDASPIILSRQTKDIDADGKLDAILITFSEIIKDSTIATGNFALETPYNDNAKTFTANVDCVGGATRGADSGYICLQFAEEGAVDGGGTPDVTYTQGTLTDNATVGNLLATTGAIASTDTAKPVVTSVYTSDAGENVVGGGVAGDGKIDAIIVEYSEDISTSVFTAGHWSLANTVLTIDGVNPGSIVTNKVKLSITQPGAGVYNSSQVADVIISQLNHANLVDGAGNTVLKGLASSVGVNDTDGTASDLVKPVVVSIKTSDAGENTTTAGDGIVDAVIVTYSEDISVNSTFTKTNWTFNTPLPNTNPLTRDNTALGGAIATNKVTLFVTQNTNYNGGETVTVANASHAADIKDASNNVPTGALNQAATDNVKPLALSAYQTGAKTVEIEYSEKMGASAASDASYYEIAGANPSSVEWVDDGTGNKIVKLTMLNDVDTDADRLDITNDVKDFNGVALDTVTGKVIIGGPTIVGLTLNNSPVTTASTAVNISGRAISSSSTFQDIRYCIGLKDQGASCIISDGAGTVVTASDGSFTDEKYENIEFTLNPVALSWGEGTYTVYVAGKANGNWGDLYSITLYVGTAPDTTAPTITLTSSTPTATTNPIVFKSNENGTGFIRYGLGADYGNQTETVTLLANTDKTVTLTDLTCGTTYNYKIYAKDAANNESSNLGNATFATTACDATPTITSISTTNADNTFVVNEVAQVILVENGSATSVSGTVGGVALAFAEAPANTWKASLNTTVAGVYTANLTVTNGTEFVNRTITYVVNDPEDIAPVVSNVALTETDNTYLVGTTTTLTVTENDTATSVIAKIGSTTYNLTETGPATGVWTNASIPVNTAGVYTLDVVTTKGDASTLRSITYVVNDPEDIAPVVSNVALTETDNTYLVGTTTTLTITENNTATSVIAKIGSTTYNLTETGPATGVWTNASIPVNTAGVYTLDVVTTKGDASTLRSITYIVNADTTAPDQDVSILNITHNSFDVVVSADEAFDLEVIFSDTVNPIHTIAINNYDNVYNTSVKTNSMSGGLTPNTVYYAQVSVKDSSGNIQSKVYAVKTVNNADVSAPTQVLSFTELTATSVKVFASADESFDSKLRYSTSADISGSSTAESYDAGFGTYKTVVVNSLTADTLYYFESTVKDAVGNERIKVYAIKTLPATVDTAPPVFVSSSPNNAATSISTTAGTATVTFDEDITIVDQSKITIVKASDSSNVKGANATVNLKTLTINYNALEYSTSYKINVATGAVKDAANNATTVDTIIYFTTASTSAPTITGLTLQNVTNTKVDIAWSTDIVPTTAQYKIGTTAYNNNIKSWTTLVPGGATSGTRDISSDAVTLTANTTYWYQVKFVKDGAIVESTPMQFTTARGVNGLYVDQISMVKSVAQYNATTPWTNGWHFRFSISTDNLAENQLQMMLDNWVSGANTLATSGNVKMLASQNIVTYNEANIAAGTGVTTDYGDTINISGMDNNPNVGGQQFFLDVFVKIPSATQASGSYSTTYGVKNSKNAGIAFGTANIAENATNTATNLITLTEDVFTNKGVTLVNNTDYTISGLPTGVTASIVTDGADNTKATLTLTGTGTVTTNTVISVTIKANALDGTVDSNVATFTITDVAPVVAFGTASINESATNTATNVITLTNDTFETLSDTLVVNTDYTIAGLPAGVTASIITDATDTKKATLTLTGTPTTPLTANATITVTLLHPAFTGTANAPAINFTIADEVVVSTPNPASVVANATLDQTFTITLTKDQLTAVSDATSIKAGLTLGGDLTGLTIGTVLKTSVSVYTVQLTGNLTRTTGSGTITLAESQLEDDANAVTTVTVTVAP